MRTRSIHGSAIALGFISLAISYIKFSRCIPGGWLTPDVYLRGCYTDITALYYVRGFATDIWPYGSGNDSLEYPLLSGIGIWLISLFSPNGVAGLLPFFHINLLTISALTLLVGYRLYVLDPRNLFLFSLSPAVISALFINWDIWAIAPLLLAIFYLNKERHWIAGLFISLSIFLKFFPVIYLVPIALVLNFRSRGFYRFFSGFMVTSLAINLPLMLTQFDGWLKFYIFNFSRGIDFGSIWHLYSLKYGWIDDINWLITPIILTFLIGCYLRYRANLLGSIFLTSVIFFTLNKVYSPQYVLWLTIVALLYFPKTKSFYLLFTLWQSGEYLYQYGIWRHLLTVLDEPSGISTDTYLVLSGLRIMSLLVLAGYAIFLLENNLIKSRRSKADI
jgi:hypothetical protein